MTDHSAHKHGRAEAVTRVQGGEHLRVCATCYNPANARATNHTLMTGANSMPPE